MDNRPTLGEDGVRACRGDGEGAEILYGHRGAKADAPENTVAGFAHARKLGVEAFELDVRLSGDDQVVVIHDATVDRTTDGSGPVSAFAAAALARLDARAEHPDWPARVGVPRLAEVLEALPDAAGWEVEIKTDAPERLARLCRRLVPTIDRFGLRGRVTVSSFDPAALELLAGTDPDLPRALIGAYDAPCFLETALRLGCAQADVRLKTGSAATVRAAQAAGLRVTGWLGNTAEDVRTLLGWGVDHVTTDVPAVALDVVRGISARSRAAPVPTPTPE